ncbi:MAG TPA: DUF3426 domain-containing protein [Woeseiaceae bacterium]|nr:DUF3426 domain-containing protein [Woeseiaceae bacterium]
MYTQCPECEIAFRVTADVLKQAAGMVRCGGCSHAFNALAFLSETMPKQSAATSARAVVPELKPEIIETDKQPPRSISAKQSAALLKTLDELAGSEIRIEDTGVEWRVLDADEAAEPAADDDVANVTDDDVVDEEPPVRRPVDELRFDDNTPLPDDFELDDDASHSQQAEDLNDAKPDAPVFAPMASQADLALTEPDEWTDLLGEFQELAIDVAPPTEGSHEAPLQETSEIADDTADTANAPLDVDTQFALQAEAMGIDITGGHAIEDIAEVLEQDLEEERAEDLEDAREDQLEAELAALDDEPEPGAEEIEYGDTLAAELEDDLEEELVEDIEDALEDALEDELDEKLEDEVLDDDADFEPDDIAQLDMIDEQFEPVVENHSMEEELALLDTESDEDLPGDRDVSAGIQHVVPPMTEEEHTVNMQIDQDLMALAIEDEDGFASTIIIPDAHVEKKASINSAEQDADAELHAPPGFETIIMEGDFVRSALDDEKREADVEAAAALAELAAMDEAKAAEQPGGKRYRMVAGVAGLIILLGIQMMHQSREALATIPAFSSTVGQIYRAIGQPVQPAWDITAWRIEASEDTIAADEGTENLTVYSRIGNTSDRAMPYPLISISLTDRYLEPVGSQILDPADYLPSDLDPRRHVEPGNTFNAVMSVQSPSIEATGYKLDVCYRLSDGRLRCAIDDFK